MKNKKFVTCTIILFLLELIIIPTNTVSIEQKDVNQIKQEQLNNFENSKKTEYIGKIYGYTHCSHGVWTWDPIPNAIVRIGPKISKSDSNGYYEVTGLQINRTYKVVANHLFYIRAVEKVTLTAEKPEKKLHIDMEWIIEYIFDILEQIIKFIP